MAYIDPDAAAAIEPELMPNERILWAGRPNPRIIFHKEDAFMIPFSLIWGGFAIVWEVMALGIGSQAANNPPPLLFALWGIPFVIIGQYIIWGRFVAAASLKKRTFYAVSENRVIAVQARRRRRVASAFIDTLPVLQKDDGKLGTGTLRFAEGMSGFYSNRRSSLSSMGALDVYGVPTFVDIDDPETAYRLIWDLREKYRKAKT